MTPEDPDIPPWRRLLRHAATLLLIGVYIAIAAPSVATVLMALRANGLSFELLYSVTLVPWAVLLAGPGAFLLGVVFGWMLIGLVQLGTNTMASRIGLAVVVATIAWWLAEPLPAGAREVEAIATSPLSDWLIWCASAAVSALVFTRGWLEYRVHPPLRED